MKTLRPVLSALAVSLMLSACTIENDEEERIVDNKEEVHFASPDLKFFYELSQKCVIGDTGEAGHILDLFDSTMIDSGDGSLTYQDPVATVEMEKCLRKADLENKTALYLNYLLSAHKLAKIAQGFAKKDKYAECAFWIRRVLNQQGAMEGYRIAGEIFIDDAKTRDIGANMLKESAKMGSESAAHTLAELAFGN